MADDERTLPPLDGDLAACVGGYLDFHRETLLAKAAGLAPDQLSQTVGASTLTLGGLVAHMAFVEDYWFGYIFGGHDAAEPWAGLDWEADDDADFTLASGLSFAELSTLLEEAVARSRAVVEQALAAPDGYSALARRPSRRGVASLAWVLVHMVEEYARHNGHADLIREAMDGSVGA